MTGCVSRQVDVPLVYFYGAASPSDYAVLYRAHVDQLAAMLEAQAAASPEVCVCAEPLPDPARPCRLLGMTSEH